MSGRSTHRPLLALLIAFAFLAVTFAIACNGNDDDDDDDNGATPQNGWSGDCNWEFDGSTQSSLSKAENQCLPPDPGDNEHYAMLDEILNVFTGAYEDQNGRAIEITCRPEGYWTLPNLIDDARCSAYWGIPVWVTFADETASRPARIDQLHPGFTAATEIGYVPGENEDEILGGRFGDVDGDWYWKFSNGDRWTKTD